MHTFLAHQITEELAVLKPEEAHHAARVLRLSTGEKVELITGTGQRFRGELLEIGKKETTARLLEPLPVWDRKNWKLFIAIAPTKNISRFEWFLEKATEIGVDEIIPIQTQNSERTRIKQERLQKIVTSAVKQSKRSFIPNVHDLMKYSDWLKFRAFPEQTFVAGCAADENQKLTGLYQKGSDVMVMIGPEGDFTDEELKMAEAVNAKKISFGKVRYRTETAGIVACHLINELNT